MADKKGKDAKKGDAKKPDAKKDDKKDSKARGAPRGAGRGARRGGDDEKGFGRRGRRGGRRGARRGEAKKETWTPVTKLGRLVAENKIRTFEEIYLFSMPIKEHQIVEKFLPDLKDEVMKVHPVQKQSAAGQRTRFKAYVIVGDGKGHVGLGVKCSKEVSIAIRAAIILAKLAVIPIRRGYWGSRFGAPHTLPCKVSGKCGSVRFRLIPAPRGTGIVAARVPKKVLEFAGVKDCYTSTRGQTKTQGNFLKATVDCIVQTYSYLTPDLWATTEFHKSPYQEHTDWLKDSRKAKKLDAVVAPSATAAAPSA